MAVVGSGPRAPVAGFSAGFPIVAPVRTRCYLHRMTVRKLSIALDESVAAKAADAAEHRGISLSAWLNAAAERALVLEAGLDAVRAWEAEHGDLTLDELTWADGVLGTGAGRTTF